MVLNRSKFNALLASIAILGACVATGISQAEESPIGEAATRTPATSVEDSATTWDKTKEVSGDAWDATREGSAKAWDKTVEVSGDAWDATKEGSAKAWDATKEGSAKAWDKTVEVSGGAWDATREGSTIAWDKTKTTVQGWQETKPESETDSNQETPAPNQSP
jgi:hypothetical protein